jgi:outer membrane lipoprotein-sorting protein
MRTVLLILFFILATPLAYAEAPVADVGSDAAPAPLPHQAPAIDQAPAQKLTAQDRSDIQRIELYLNELKSITADFMQIDDHGGIMHGSIVIKRPGKMRVTYTEPKGDFIVADGDFVHIWNADLQSQTNVPENSSLANFILRDPIALSGDVTVSRFQRFPAKLELTLVETDDPAAGQLTLIFEDHPLLLRQWRVIDPSGHTIGVNLENEQSDVEIADNMFNFVPPSFGHGLHTQTLP